MASGGSLLKRVVLALVVSVGALLGSAANSYGEVSSDAGLVYDGTFGTVTETIGTTLVGAGGGTVSITLTSDRLGVTRIENESFMVGSDSSIYRFGQQTYFAPPLPIVDGSVSAQPPIILERDSYSTLNLEIHIDSETQLSGTGQIVGGFTSLVAPFTAVGPVEPRPANALLTAQVEGQGGTISIGLDAFQGLQSYTLHNVSFPPCVTAPQTLPVIFDSPLPVEGKSHAWLSLGDYGLHRLWFIGQRNGDSFAGTLRIFPGDCSTQLRWTMTDAMTPESTVAPTPAPPVGPALPSTGTGPASSVKSWWIGVVALAAAALSVARIRRPG